MLNGENATCCVGLCNLTNRLMIVNAGLTMTEGTAILKYWPDQQSLIFWHWQLKSIPDSVKKYMFSSSFIPQPGPCYPIGNGMINVQRHDRTQLAS